MGRYILSWFVFFFLWFQVMKPMLERKRRARINRCLDELKELMVTALQAEGENVSKLEKADILELTVRHLHKLRRQQRLAVNPVTDADRFRAGFTHCATEVSRCLAATPGVDVRLGTKLMTHLGHRLNDMDRLSPLSVRVQDTTGSSSPAPSSPASTNSYTMPLTPSSSGSSSPDSEYNHNSGLLLKVVDMSIKSSTKSDPVWRPW